MAVTSYHDHFCGRHVGTLHCMNEISVHPCNGIKYIQHSAYIMGLMQQFAAISDWLMEAP